MFRIFFRCVLKVSLVIAWLKRRSFLLKNRIIFMAITGFFWMSMPNCSRSTDISDTLVTATAVSILSAVAHAGYYAEKITRTQKIRSIICNCRIFFYQLNIAVSDYIKIIRVFFAFNYYKGFLSDNLQL